MLKYIIIYHYIVNRFATHPVGTASARFQNGSRERFDNI